MAIDKQKLILEIETQTKDSRQKLGAVEGDIERLGKTAEKTSDKTSQSMKEMQARYESLAAQVARNTEAGRMYSGQNSDLQAEIERASQSHATAAAAMKGAAQATNRVAGSSANAADSMGRLNAEAVQTPGIFGQILKSMGKTASAIDDTIRSIAGIITTIRDFIHLVTELTKPENLEKLSKLIFLFSVLARIKGYKQVADGLRGVSKQVAVMAIEMENTGGIFQREFDVMVRKARLFQNVVDTFGTLGDVIGGTLVAFAIAGLNEGLTRVAKNMGIVDKSLEELVTKMGPFGAVLRKELNVIAGNIGKIFGAEFEILFRRGASLIGKFLTVDIAKVATKALKVYFGGISEGISAVSKAIIKNSTVGAAQISVFKIAMIDFSAAVQIAGQRMAETFGAVGQLMKAVFAPAIAAFGGIASSAGKAGKAVSGLIPTFKSVSRIQILTDPTAELNLFVRAGQNAANARLAHAKATLGLMSKAEADFTNRFIIQAKQRALISQGFIKEAMKMEVEFVAAARKAGGIRLVMAKNVSKSITQDFTNNFNKMSKAGTASAGLAGEVYNQLTRAALLTAKAIGPIIPALIHLGITAGTVLMAMGGFLPPLIIQLAFFANDLRIFGKSYVALGNMIVNVSSGIVNAITNAFVQAGMAVSGFFGTFGRASTVGAKQISIFRIAMIDWRAAASIMGDRLLGLTANIIKLGSTLLKIPFGLFTDAFVKSGKAIMGLRFGVVAMAPVIDIFTGKIIQAGDAPGKMIESISRLSKMLSMTANNTFRMTIGTLGDMAKAFGSGQGLDRFSKAMQAATARSFDFTIRLQLMQHSMNKFIENPFIRSGGLLLVKPFEMFAKGSQAALITMARLTNNFQDIVEIQIAVRDQFARLANSIGNFGSKSTVGAQQISTFQRVLMELRATIQTGFNSITKFSSELISKFGPAMKTVSQNVAIFGKGFMDGFITPLKASANIIGNSDRLLVKMGSFTLKNAAAGTIALTEAGTFLAPAMAAIGVAISNSDSRLAQFAGVTLLVAAAALGGFAAIVTALARKIGGEMISMGQSLMASMAEWEKIAQKGQVTTMIFEKVMINFGKTFGVKLVGSIDQAKEALSELVKNSTFGMGEMIKSFKLLTAEGAALGLNFATKMELMQISMDVAAGTSSELFDVVQAVNSALLGQAQALNGLGVMTNEAALSHTHYAKELGKTIDKMSEAEKTEARLQAIRENSKSFMGLAAELTGSIAGATAKYDASLKALVGTLGEQGTFTIAYLALLQNLHTAFLNLPDPIIAMTGALVDFGGVFLTITGTIIKYSLLVLSLTTIIGIAVGAIEGFTIVQWLLSAGFAAAAGAINTNTYGIVVNTVAVTGLQTAYINLIAVLKGSLLVTLRLAGAAFVSLAGKILLVTKSILTSPLFWKMAFVVISVMALIKAYQKLSKELDKLNEIYGKTNTTTGQNITLMGELGNIAEKTFGFMVDVAALVIIGLMKIWDFLKLAATGYQLLWASITGNKEAMAELRAEGELILEHYAGLETLADGALASIKKRWGGTALAAENAKNKIKGVSEQAKKAAESLEIMSVATTRMGLLINSSSLQAQIFGDKYEQANDRVLGLSTGMDKAKVALLDTNTAFRNGTKKAEDLAEANKNLIDATRDHKTAMMERAKIAKDDMANVKSLNDSLLTSELQRTNRLVEATEMRRDAELLALDEIENGLRRIQKFRVEDLNAINKARDAIKAQADAQTKLDIVSQKQGEMNKISKETGAKFSFDAEQLGQIETMFGEGASSMAGAASSMASGALGMAGVADKMIDAAQALIDFLPNLMNKFAKLFTSLTELPMKLVEGLTNIFSSIAGFITNFIPNIIGMIGDWFIALFDGILIKLPDAFVKLFTEGLPNALDGLINKIPIIATKFVYGFITAMPKIVLSFIHFIIVGIPRIIKSFVKMIPVLAKALVQAIVEAFKEIGNMFKGIFNGEEMVEKIHSGIKKFAREATNAASELFKVTELRMGAKGLDLSDKIRDAIMSASFSFVGLLQWIWNKLVEAWRAVWGWISDLWDGFINLLKKAWAWISEVWDALMSMLRTLWEWVAELWGNLTAALKEVWVWIDEKIIQPFMIALKWVFDSIIRPILEAFVDILQALWENIIQPIMNLFVKGLQALWDGLGILWETFKTITETFVTAISASWELIKGIFETFVTAISTLWETFKTIVTSLEGVGTRIWEGFKAGVDAAGDWVKEIGTKMWGGLKAGLDGATSKLKGYGTEIWNGLSAGFDLLKAKIEGIFNALNPAALFDKIFKLPSNWSGKGTVEKALGIDVPMVKFAQGGVLPGSAAVPGDSEMNDRILALLSPGEAVIPRTAMGQPGVKEIVQNIIDGKINPPKFAGGVVGLIQDATGVDLSNPSSWSINDLTNALSGLDPSAIDFSQLDPSNIDWSQMSAENAGKAYERIKGEIKAGSANIGEFLKEMADQLGLSGLFGGMWDMVMHYVSKFVKRMFEANAFPGGDASGVNVPGFTSMAYNPLTAPIMPGTAAVILDPNDPRWETMGIPPISQEQIDALGNLAVSGIDITAMAPLGTAAIETFARGGLIRAANGVITAANGEPLIGASPGEFVVQKPAVQSIGADTLSRLNAGGASAMGGGGQSFNFTVEVNVETTQPVDERFIRDRIGPEIKEMLRRESLDGVRILSERGVS